MSKLLLVISLLWLALSGCNASSNSSTQSGTQKESSPFKVSDIILASNQGSVNGAWYYWSEVEEVNGDKIVVKPIGSKSYVNKFTTSPNLITTKENCGNKPVKEGDAVIYQVPDGDLFVLSTVTSYTNGTVDVSMRRNKRGEVLSWQEYEKRKPLTKWCTFSQPLPIEK